MGGPEMAISRHATTYRQDQRDLGGKPDRSQRIHSTCSRTDVIFIVLKRGASPFCKTLKAPMKALFMNDVANVEWMTKRL